MVPPHRALSAVARESDRAGMSQAGRKPADMLHHTNEERANASGPAR